MLLTWGIYSTFGVFFKPILIEFDWTRAVTSVASSIFWVIQGLLAIVVGRVNDRFGPRIVVTVCGSILGLGYLLLSQISALWQLYLFYGVVIATGMSGFFIPLASTAARWFVKRRGIMTGIIIAGVSLGGLFAPPVANWLISIYDWRVSYIILGSIALVVVIPVAQLLRGDPIQVGQTPYGENEKRGKRPKGVTETFSLKEAAPTRQFWLISSIFLCEGFCAGIITVHIAAHATDLGLSTASAANILAIIGGMAVIGKIVLSVVADRVSNRQVFIIGFSLMATALFGLVPAIEKWTLYLFAAVFGFATGCAISESPIVAEFFGLRSHGLLLGVVSFGYCIGAAVGPFLAGYLFDVTSSYNLAFWGCAAISVIGLIVTILLKPIRGKQVKIEAM